MSRYVVLGAVAATVVCTLAAASSATPPGKNGLIAFTRYADANRSSGSIYVINANGKGERRVTRAPAGARDTQPDWSPDGSRIVFERQYEDKPYEVFSVRPDGSGLTQIDPGCPTGEEKNFCEEDGPAWSPDGRRIAFVNGFGGLKFISGEEWIEVSAISLMNADGSAVRQLTQLERPTSSEDHEPVWSPSGKQIAFVRLNSTAKPRNRQAIFVMNADGSGVRRVTPWSLNAGDHPDWSPDGRRILFRSTTSDLYGPLYTVRPNGTGLKQLTSFKPGIEVLSASFSPDGRSIVSSRSGKGRLPDLFVMRSDGKKIRQLTRTTLWDSAPDWGPAG
jgi:TolB protein